MLVRVVPLFCFCCGLAGALPFVTTWNTTFANENIVLPPINFQANVTIDWGDATPLNITSSSGLYSFVHTYSSPGLHNVSIEGQIQWQQADSNTTKDKLVNISNWGDGFLVYQNTHLFANYINLRVASPDTQPVFLPGASLLGMFRDTSINSLLNWDLINVTSLERMFEETRLLNQPINFRNTQGVQSTARMFQGSRDFNRPFHFDASGLLTAASMFSSAYSFDQVVNLTNSSLLTNTSYMFSYTRSFNQPIIFDTSSVTTMQGMFFYAFKFKQLLTFDTSQVTNMVIMFSGAESFNQPINFNTPKLTRADGMFASAHGFNQPVVLDTSNVTSMLRMFYDAVNFSSTVNFTSTAKVTNMDAMFLFATGFTQDLSSWDTQSVLDCDFFCSQCIPPAFPVCVPPTPSPTKTPSTSVPSTSAPSTGAPSTSAPSTSAPSTRAPSAPSLAPSVAPSPRAAVSAAAPLTSLGWALLLPLALWG